MTGGMFLSIDFEDIAHDFKRDLGLWETGPLRVDALWRSYDQIGAFLARNGGTRATFFCTGIIADQAPDLIARIAADGHEVACHYHFHDVMDRQGVDEVAHFAARAKAALETAAGTEVTGFRAPKFRIDRAAPEQYRAIARLFRYDSSWFGAGPAEARAFLQWFGLGDLALFPIYAGRAHRALPPMKLGGSYLKLFPAAVARRLVADCAAAGMVPHVYLHPYEFSAEGDYRLSRAERAPLGWRRSVYLGLRQHQWHTVGNAGLAAKLSDLVAARGLRGRLCDHLADAVRA